MIFFGLKIRSIYPKHSFLIALDMSICLLTIWLAVSFKNENWFVIPASTWPLLCLAMGFAFAALFGQGIYRWMDLSLSSAHMIQLVKACSIYAVLFLTACVVLYPTGIPRSVGVIQPVLFFIFVVLSRFFIALWFDPFTRTRKTQAKPVFIYGAGAAGVKVARLLKSEYAIKGFLDDDEAKKDLLLSNVPVIYSPEIADSSQTGIDTVILALPSITGVRREQIYEQLSSLGYYIFTISRLPELLLKKSDIGTVRAIELEDLLERTTARPNEQLMKLQITDKTVLVTGAGGSIGAELCRQISILHPVEIIILDHSEYNLFKIYQELDYQNLGSTVLSPKLMSAENPESMKQLFAEKKIDTIFHAAAYKHVNLIELNATSGLKNNILSTLTLVELAKIHDVESFVLISTDKAVRPSSIMGVSKRIAELIVTGQSCENTNFAVVRFGNVLGSSGSVVPIFKEQIARGGPITLTDPQVSRFFMTISEAASLVIQASSLNSQSTIFALEMGEPIKVISIAEKLLALEGLTPTYEESPEPGQIQIQFTGLRPGEKLHEELSVTPEHRSTFHPKIREISDPVLTQQHYELLISKLRDTRENAEQTLLNFCVKLISSVDKIEIGEKTNVE